MEDIILVTGRHLARSWINVAFSESLGGSQVSFKVRGSGDSNVHLEDRDVRGGELKLGPSGEVSFHINLLSPELMTLILWVPESTREPMHFRSRIPCCSYPESLAKDPGSRTD